MSKFALNSRGHFIVVAAILLFVSGSKVFSQTQPNLVTNPSFENGSGGKPDNWSAINYGDTTLNWTNVSSHSGSYSISIGNISSSTTSKWVSDYIDVAPNTAYEYSYWIFATKDPKAGQYFRLAQEFCDSQGNYITTNSSSVNYSLNQWRQTIRTTMIYPNVTKTRFVISFDNNGQGYDGVGYFDDFELKQVNPIVSLRLLKPTGGDTLVAKSTYDIQWTSQNISFVDIKVSYKGGGGTNDWLFIARNIPASQGSYAWTIPDTTSNRAPIWLYDSSNSDFFAPTDNIRGVKIVSATYGMTLNSRNLNVGAARVGQSKDAVLTLTNTGNSSLTVNLASGNTSFTPRPSSLTITPGASARDTIRYIPSRFGVDTTRIILTSNAPSSPDTVIVSGNSPAPVLNVSATSIAFTDRAKGDSAVIDLYLKNNSINAMTLGSVTTASGAFAATTGSMTVAGLDSALLTVKFRPVSFGTFVDTIKIVSDGGNANIRLMAMSPYPILFRNRAAVDFGEVAKGGVRSQTLVIRNLSINTLMIDSAKTRTRWFGALLQNHSITSTDSLVLPLYFTPDSLRAYVDTLLLYNNSSAGIVKVALSGNSPNPVLSVSSLALNLPHVAVGDSVTKSVWLYNNTPNVVTVSGISNVTQLFSTSRSVPFQVNGLDSGEVNVKFKPKAFGDASDLFTITSDGGTLKVLVNGTSPYPFASVRQQRLDFWSLSKDSTRRLTFTIVDTSINPLRIDTLYTATKYFRVPSQKNPASVKKGDSLSYVVTFTPDSARIFMDTVFIQTNSLSPLRKLVVRGEGTLVITSVGNGVAPRIFALCQNYPNPFNPSTEIKFELPRSTYVALKIFNTLGQVVAILVDEHMAAGVHQVRWDANAPSGIYFYRLQAGEFLETKRMILLR